ncbi:MAG: hypothetical protein IJ148_00655 [Bacteroidaceae bacterium]|nr:hypothetical protein [Bacteroidaceae bacterium]
MKTNIIRSNLCSIGLALCLLYAIALSGCSGASKGNTKDVEVAKSNENRSSSFEYSMPVDLTDILQAYELYQKSSADEQESILFSFVDEEMCEGEVTLFEDTSFVIRLPEYKDSKIPFLAVAEEFYNNCSFTWNIWSNFEVWYRGKTAGDLRSDKDIIQSIRAFDLKTIRDVELNKAAQSYRDSILVLMSMGLDEWDDAHNAWNVRGTYIDVITKKACRFYEDRDEFQDRYNIIVDFAEGLGDDKSSHFVNTNEDEQLKVMLSELNTCANFDEQCSLWRRWANSKESKGEESWLVAVGNKLMESGNYNPNLNRIWITWRTLCQIYYCGVSKDSVIPNPFYNQYRRICYQTCLKRIETHPDDIFAMNCAASLAGNPNVIRIGNFPYGNDAVIDASQMMPERFKSDDLSDDNEEEIE